MKKRIARKVLDGVAAGCRRYKETTLLRAIARGVAEHDAPVQVITISSDAAVPDVVFIPTVWTTDPPGEVVQPFQVSSTDAATARRGMARTSTGVAPVTSIPTTREELEKLTIPQLKALHASVTNGAPAFPAGARKAEIVSALLVAQQARPQ